MNTPNTPNYFLRYIRMPKTPFHVRWVVLFFIGIFFLLWISAISAPALFPEGVVIEIPNGVTLDDVATLLEEKSIVRSAMLFKGLVWFGWGDENVVSGQYVFKIPRTVFGIAGRIASGAYGLDFEEVLIPEGASVREAALLVKQKIPVFDVKHFLEIALPDEGYLFPDTYRFLPNVTSEVVRRDMRQNFDVRTLELTGKVVASGKNLHEIVTMASILEEEARTMHTRRVIAGILWKRIVMGMPLQVDAVFVYINGKNTYQLTTNDLKIDSPYNTYKHKGLPPGPITNPGLESLRAALDPIETPYLFYLSDKEGNMHYARTHEEHVRNKEIYVR